MKKTVSLTQNRDFRSIYARGRSSAGVYLVAYTRKNRCGSLRLGITVSAKVGNAVVRNRIRRRIKEVYRLNEDSYKPGMDIVWVSRVRAAEAGFHELKKDMLSLSVRLGLIQ